MIHGILNVGGRLLADNKESTVDEPHTMLLFSILFSISIATERGRVTLDCFGRLLCLLGATVEFRLADARWLLRLLLIERVG